MSRGRASLRPKVAMEPFDLEKMFRKYLIMLLKWQIDTNLAPS
uniref:Uncharacterized protein n=1 Tax=Arundo donax TaxID=35708 RepID=A0A0A9BHS0_ARUDO